MQESQASCLGQLLSIASSSEDLSDDVITDNMVAAAFGNASAGPTAAKLLQHLSASDTTLRERLRNELALQGGEPAPRLLFTGAGAGLCLAQSKSPRCNHAYGRESPAVLQSDCALAAACALTETDQY
jgi:hypothetical protein